MLFGKKKLLEKNELLESELAVFKDMQDDLRREMDYFLLDFEGNFIETNPQFLATCGYTQQEVINKPLQNLMSEKALNTELCKKMFDALAKRIHWHGAMLIQTKQGKDVWYRTIIQPKINNKSIAVYSTELTKTISQSREHKDMLAALTRSSAVIEFSLDCTILEANENFFSCAENFMMFTNNLV